MEKWIGIVGGGQLGRMLANAAHELGFKVAILEAAPGSPAGLVADREIIGRVTEEAGIHELANMSDHMTFEIESADAHTLRELTRAGFDINPSAETLEIIKDKFRQKEFLRAHDIPVADFALIESVDDAKRQAEIFGYPFLLKARFGAYDGRGNRVIRREEDIAAAFAELSSSPLYAERFVPFMKELSVVVVRGKKGEEKNYPVVETIHENNICHMVIAPAEIDGAIRTRAEEIAGRVIAHLKGVGVFAVEMFMTEDGDVVVNEIAPRVHNSGHHSIEGCETSQFENHIRAISGMPLGSTALKAPVAVMVNILGDRTGMAEPRGIEEAESLSGVHVHIYGKVETRPERKMGHITALGDTHSETIARATEARKRISI